MDYAKITTDKRCMDLPNPYHLTVSNPTEEQKKVIADFDGWLEKVYTEQPEHDPEKEYCTDYWEEENHKAVQKWEIHELPEREAELEDYQTQMGRLGVEDDTPGLTDYQTQMEKLGVSDEHTD